MTKTRKAEKEKNRYYPFVGMEKARDRIMTYLEASSPGTLKINYINMTLCGPGEKPLIVRDYRQGSIRQVLSDFCSVAEFSNKFVSPASMTIYEDGTIILDEPDLTKANEKVEFFETVKQ